MLDFIITGLPRSTNTTATWATLKDVEMQPNFVGLSIGPEVTRRLYRELEAIALGGLQ